MSLLDDYEFLAISGESNNVSGISKLDLEKLLRERNVSGTTGAGPTGPVGFQGSPGPQGATGAGVANYVDLPDTPNNLSDKTVALNVNSAASAIQHLSDRIVISGTGAVSAANTATICGGEASAPQSIDIGSSGSISGREIFRLHSNGKVSSGNRITAINSDFNTCTGNANTLIQSRGGTIDVLGNYNSIIASSDSTIDTNFSTIVSSDGSKSESNVSSIISSNNSSMLSGPPGALTARYLDTILASNNSQIGDGNSLSPYTRNRGSSIIASGSSDLDFVNGGLCSIIGSRGGCELTNYLNSSLNCKDTKMTGSTSSTITSSNVTVATDRSITISAENSYIGSTGSGGPPYSSIISSSNCSIDPGSLKCNSIVGSNECKHYSGNYACGFFGSSSCDITNGKFSSITTSANSCEITSGIQTSYNSIIGSITSDISSAEKANSIIGSDGCTINSSASYATIIASTNSTCSAKGASIIASDNVTNSGKFSSVFCGKDATYNNTVDYAFVAPNLIFVTEMQSSDRRRKKNIENLEIENLLEKINEIFTYKYNLKNEDDKMPLRTGFIAQEVQKSIPDLCVENGDDWLGIDQSGLVNVILYAIKELTKKNEILEDKIIQAELKINGN